MAILVIWASPNEQGLTASAKEQVLAGITGTGTAIHEVHLNKSRLGRCIACHDGWGLCRSAGQCVLADDFLPLYEALREADGIVWITPVYWHDVAECLKAFLDRLRRCETAHNHALRGKKNMLVACAGGTGRGAVRCLHILETTLGHMEMVALERLPVIRFNRDYMLPALEAAGKAFAAACTGDRFHKTDR